MGGKAPASVMVQSCVTGLKPGTGTSRFGAVEAGMSNSILFGPVVAAFDARLAARSEPSVGLELSPLSAVLVTANVASSRRDSSGSRPATTRAGRDRTRRVRREWDGTE